MPSLRALTLRVITLHRHLHVLFPPDFMTCSVSHRDASLPFLAWRGINYNEAPLTFSPRSLQHHTFPQNTRWLACCHQGICDARSPYHNVLVASLRLNCKSLTNLTGTFFLLDPLINNPRSFIVQTMNFPGPTELSGSALRSISREDCCPDRFHGWLRGHFVPYLVWHPVMSYCKAAL
jgi:hypothetical protein